MKEKKKTSFLSINPSTGFNNLAHWERKWFKGELKMIREMMRMSQTCNFCAAIGRFSYRSLYACFLPFWLFFLFLFAINHSYREIIWKKKNRSKNNFRSKHKMKSRHKDQQQRKKKKRSQKRVKERREPKMFNENEAQAYRWVFAERLTKQKKKTKFQN